MTNKKNKLEHPCFPQPSDTNIKVWRYVDTSKFIDILRRKSLFMSRLDLLGDPHEGSITKANQVTRAIEFEKAGISNFIPHIETNTKNINQTVFVSCWYGDYHESEAMWKLYCGDNKGVAIQTTYKKLVDSVMYDDELYVGLVNYIDYETEWFPGGNIFYPIMHKRKAFQHEKEIRLVKLNLDQKIEGAQPRPDGIYCSWHMEKFAESIFVNPYAESWYYEVIKDILEKYGFKIDLKWSTIKSKPYY